MLHYLETGDTVTHGVAYLLLAMSVASWCFLIAKSWMLVRAKRQGPRALALFWQTQTLSDAVLAIRGVDRERILLLGAVAGGGDPAAVTAALDPPFRPEDSISASSNMLLLPTSGTPALLRRFRRPRGRGGFLTQIECLLPVLVRHRDEFLLFGRVRLEQVLENFSQFVGGLFRKHTSQPRKSGHSECNSRASSSSIGASPSGVRHAPFKRIAIGSPRGKWRTPRSKILRGIAIRPKTAPATCPEYI